MTAKELFLEADDGILTAKARVVLVVYLKNSHIS
jgi:hypothetical protein